ncbi:MAG: STAS domain-containing protein [Clostridiales bacterium]|nr:STAS domain-containing protein [Clostridiales bacterium]
MLDIQKTIDSGKALFAVKGRLDSITAPDLEKELEENLSGAEELVIDFDGLEYISSAGLRVLLAAKEIMGDKPFIIKNVNEVIRDVFDVTGFSSFLNIE